MSEASMVGYTMEYLADGKVNVTSPVGMEYEVGLFPPSCTCPSWGRNGQPCKHFDFVLLTLEADCSGFERYEQRQVNPKPKRLEDDPEACILALYLD